MKNYVLVFILNDDPHAYHFDFMNMRMIDSVKVIDPLYCCHKFVLTNICAVRCENIFAFIV